jgi:predicted DNA-binding transcriptional regulator AlpA
MNKTSIAPGAKVAEFQSLLVESQAASYLGLRNPGSLRNMRCKGYGPKFVQMGRFIRYRIKDLDQWIEESLRDPAA